MILEHDHVASMQF